MKGVVFLIALLFALSVQGQNSTCQTCPAKGCGNGICEAGLEDCQSCPFDCGLCPTCDNICGNHLCEAGALESPCNCPQDCGICCVDGLCRGLENPANCPQDCTGTLTGTVYDVETLELLDNATVVCQSRSMSVSGFSSNGGAFAFAGLPADFYTCSATKAEYMTGANTIFFQPGSAVLVNSTIRIPLRQPPGMIIGYVKDGYGNFFIRGANVTCTYLARDMNKFTTNLGSYFFHDLKPGTYSCWAGAPGYSPAPRITAEVFRGVVTTVNFTLNPIPPNLFGKVIDRTTGLTLAGATVKCWLARDKSDLPTVLSDPVGAFAHFKLLASIYNCESFLTGYTRGKDVACLEWGKNGTVTLIMTKLPSTLRGNVTEKETGVPIFGAKVSCVSTITYGQNTPRDGKYEFRTVQSGDYTCTCTAPDYDSDVKTVFVPAGQIAIANCLLTPKPATLTGRVYDVETNSSLSGYTVSCVHVDKQLTFSTTSNVTNGRYLFTPVPAGLMSCQCLGDATYSGSNGSVTLVRGGFHVLDCPMTPYKGSLRVKVFDSEDKTPIAGASVFCSSSLGRTVTFTTDSLGTEFLLNLRIQTWTCFASADGYASSSNKSGIIVNAKELLLEFPLDPLPGGIIGHVYNAKGMVGIVGVTVVCNFVSSGVLIGSTTTDSTGFYYFLNVHRGDVVCKASLPDFTSDSKTGTVFRARNTTIDFIIGGIPGRLIVFVGVDPTREILPGSSVSCSNVDDATVSLTGLTISDGTITFEQVPAGTYTCGATSEGYFPNSKSGIIVFLNKDTRAEILLKAMPGLLIITTVDDSTNLPLPNCTVIVSPGALTSRSNASAVTTYTVAAGTYSAVGSHPGYLDGSKTGIVVFRAGITTAELRLVPLPGALIVTVVSSVDGAPLPGSSVTCTGGSFNNVTIAPAPLASITYVMSEYIAYTCTGSLQFYTTDTKTSDVVTRAGITTLKLILTPLPNQLIVIVRELITEKLITTAFVTVTTYTETAVDSAASVTYNPLAPGTYVASARASGYASNSTGVPGITSTSHGQFVTVTIYLKPIPCQLTVRTVLATDNSPLAGVAVSVTGFPTFTTGTNGTFSYVFDTLPISGTVSAALALYTNDGDQTFTCGLNGTLNVVIKFTPLPNQLIVIVRELITERLITSAFVTVTTYTETAVDAAASVTYDPIAPGTYIASARAAGYATNSTGVPGLTSTSHGLSVTVTIYLKPIPCQLTVRTVLDSDNSPLAGVAVSVTGFSTLTTGPNGTFIYTFDTLPVSGTVSAVLDKYTSSGDQTFTCALNGSLNVVIRFTPIPNRLIVIVKEIITEKLITSAFVRVTVSSFAETGVDSAASATFFPLDAGVYVANARADGYLSNSTAVPGIDINTHAATVTVTIYLRPIPCILTVRTVLAADDSAVAGVNVIVSGVAGSQLSPANGTLSYIIGVDAGVSNGVVSGSLSGYTTNGDQAYACALNTTITVVIRLIPIPNQILVTVLDAKTFELITTAFVTLTPGFATETAVDSTASVLYNVVPAGTYTAFARADGYTSNSTGPTTVLRNQTVHIYVYLTQLPCILRVLVVTSQNNSLVIPGANLQLNDASANKSSNAFGFVDYVLPYNTATRVSGSKVGYKAGFTDFTCGKGENKTVIVQLPEVLMIVFDAADAKTLTGPNNDLHPNLSNFTLKFNGIDVPADPTDTRYHYLAVDSLPISGEVIATSLGFNDQTDTGVRFTLTSRNYTILLAPQEFTVFFTPVEEVSEGGLTGVRREVPYPADGIVSNNYWTLEDKNSTYVAYVPKDVITVGGSVFRDSTPVSSATYVLAQTFTYDNGTQLTIMTGKFDNISPNSFLLKADDATQMNANWPTALVSGSTRRVTLRIPEFTETTVRKLLFFFPYSINSGYVVVRVSTRDSTGANSVFGQNDFILVTVSTSGNSPFNNYNNKNVKMQDTPLAIFEFPFAFQTRITGIAYSASSSFNLTVSNYINPDTGALLTSKAGNTVYDSLNSFTFDLTASIFNVDTTTGQKIRDVTKHNYLTRDYVLVQKPPQKKRDESD